MQNINAAAQADGSQSWPHGPSWRAEAGRLGRADAMRAALAERWPALTRDRLSSVAILGAAGEGVRLAERAQALGVSVAAIVDDDPERQGAVIAGVEARAVDTLAELDRATPVIVASHRPLGALDRLRAFGFETVALFLVLQALDPIAWPPHMFHDGWFQDLEENLERYAELDAALADARSRETLDAIIGFRLTGDLAALAPVLDVDLYAPEGVIAFGEDEVYVEGGAYDGDTIRLFIENVRGRFDRVVGFEPDPATYARLAAAFADEPRVEAVERGLGAREETLRFSADGSRGAMATAEGEIEIKTLALDSYLGEDRVTYIKMNIEGAELDALEGARRALERWAPRLAISAYHRPTDLWRVPLLMRALNPSQALYLRQHVAGVVETVAYSAPPPAV